MFRIMCDGQCIYDDTTADQRFRVSEPTLKLEDNAAGSLEFKALKDSAAYDIVVPFYSLVTVYRNGEELWFGRVASVETDYWEVKTVYCEGAYSFLNDYFCIESTRISDSDPKTCARNFVDKVLGDYNSFLPQNDPRRIYLGIFDIDTNNIEYELPDGETRAVHKTSRDIQYGQCYEYISSLVDEVKCHIKMRHGNDGKLYIDFLQDSSLWQLSQQRIEFGKNLLDITKKFDISSSITAVFPTGGDIEGSGEPSDKYLIDVGGGEPLRYILQKPELVAKYGLIIEHVDFSNTKDRAQLLEWTQRYLDDKTQEIVEYTAKAIDMFYYNQSDYPIDLYQTVKIYSRPHGLTDLSLGLKVKAVELGLDNPSKCVYTLGNKSDSAISSGV